MEPTSLLPAALAELERALAAATPAAAASPARGAATNAARRAHGEVFSPAPPTLEARRARGQVFTPAARTPETRRARGQVFTPAPRTPETRRARGQVFTPAPLARLVCHLTLAPLGGGPLRVLDPACGDGRFLRAAAEVRAAAAGPDHGDELLGIERDPALAAACRREVPGARVRVAEALFALPAAARGVDAVIGNPPYVRSIRMREADPALWRRVRGAFTATAHGEWDLYGAFLEAALGWVRPGGRIGLVVPSRWLTARWAARLRGALAARGVLRQVIDFGATQVFPDATTYASIVIMQREASPAAAGSGRGAVERAGAVVPAWRRAAAGWVSGVIEVARLGERPWAMSDPGSDSDSDSGSDSDAGLNDPLTLSEAPKGRSRRDSGSAPVSPPSPFALSKAPEGPRRRARPSLPAATAPLTLGDVARIAKGTGTNADGVFLLTAAELDGALVHGTDGDGARVTIELAATRPCWRGRDIQPGARATARCLLPYDDDGALVPLAELRRRWPRAAAHLAAHRARLEARERGRFAGPAYHVFGRPQNLAFLLDPAPKVIVPDVARTPRAVLDATGALVLDTAYALRPRPDAPPPWRDPRALLALFASSRVLAWLERAGVPLRGDYRRFKTAFLAPMPLPDRVP